ncbi:hypothetical protein PIB30_001341 [Stylosanthes scabra]|uniref:Uncharacterized protein n=1 Tax=Stylosanthes scabra TaxID=79078 RepID=A0ABU6Y4K8_9FABA|nr:hypothetical protein [Stylosanthes scabra]
MRERKCSFRGEALGRVRGLDPKKKKKKEIVPPSVPATLAKEVKVPRPLDAAETRLYGGVEEAVLTQPSVVESDSLFEFRRNFPLMEDSGAEGDYVLEAAWPSDRVPFRAGEEGPYFLWVYQELFTCLRMRLLFSNFQRDVMTRCRVAVSQLHLNGWGFILAFEKVCLHNGFHPTIRLFFYKYDVHFSLGGYGYISFWARQGRKLFDSYEDSIQEFKWHYFKVLATSGKRAFWLDHENKPFPWVYWNPEVKDFTVYNLEPLEMAAFKFLVSLPSGLPKRNKFTCRFILDGSDAEVGKYLGWRIRLGWVPGRFFRPVARCHCYCGCCCLRLYCCWYFRLRCCWASSCGIFHSSAPSFDYF